MLQRGLGRAVRTWPGIIVSAGSGGAASVASDGRDRPLRQGKLDGMQDPQKRNWRAHPAPGWSKVRLALSGVESVAQAGPLAASAVGDDRWRIQHGGGRQGHSGSVLWVDQGQPGPAPPRGCRHRVPSESTPHPRNRWTGIGLPYNTGRSILAGLSQRPRVFVRGVPNGCRRDLDPGRDRRRARRRGWHVNTPARRSRF